jgi:hypothetical protein
MFKFKNNDDDSPQEPIDDGKVSNYNPFTLFLILILLILADSNAYSLDFLTDFQTKLQKISRKKR